jgi:hypothetical protein
MGFIIIFCSLWCGIIWDYQPKIYNKAVYKEDYSRYQKKNERMNKNNLVK